VSRDVSKLIADLELVPTPDLILVLMARFDNAVLVGERPSKIPSDGVELVWTGDIPTAKGWSEFASDVLGDEMRLMLPEPDDEEEDGVAERHE